MSQNLILGQGPVLIQHPRSFQSEIKLGRGLELLKKAARLLSLPSYSDQHLFPPPQICSHACFLLRMPSLSLHRAGWLLTFSPFFSTAPSACFTCSLTPPQTPSITTLLCYLTLVTLRKDLDSALFSVSFAIVTAFPSCSLQSSATSNGIELLTVL